MPNVVVGLAAFEVAEWAESDDASDDLVDLDAIEADVAETALEGDEAGPDETDTGDEEGDEGSPLDLALVQVLSGAEVTEHEDGTVTWTGADGEVLARLVRSGPEEGQLELSDAAQEALLAALPGIGESDEDGDEAAGDPLEELAIIRAILEAAELGTWDEAEVPVEDCLDLDTPFDGSIHLLRRLAAYVEQGLPLPEPGRLSAEADEPDPVLVAAYGTPPRKGIWVEGLTMYRTDNEDAPGTFDHLIRHDGDDGYYVPVDFAELIGGDVPGKYVGSSQRLLAELDALAEALGVPADLSHDDERLWDLVSEQNAAEAGEVEGSGEGWERYAAEVATLVQLRAAARHSVDRGASIVFS